MAGNFAIFQSDPKDGLSRVSREDKNVFGRNIGVRLLDAMAEVAELPDYLPGQREIPLPLETMVGEAYASDLRQQYVKKG